MNGQKKKDLVFSQRYKRPIFLGIITDKKRASYVCVCVCGIDKYRSDGHAARMKLLVEVAEQSEKGRNLDIYGWWTKCTSNERERIAHTRVHV